MVKLRTWMFQALKSRAEFRSFSPKNGVDERTGDAVKRPHGPRASCEGVIAAWYSMFGGDSVLYFET